MNNGFKIDALVLICMLLVTLSKAQNLTHGPVVGGITANSANFVLRTDTAASIRIEISASSDFSISTLSNSTNTGTNSDFWGKVSISGLTPNTKYYYRVVIEGSAVNDGIERYFTTFPEEGTVSDFTFITGSCQQAGNDPFSNQGDIFPIIADEQPAFFLHQGDWGYPDTTDSEQGTPDNYFTLDFANIQESYRSRYDPNFPMIDLLRVTSVDYTYDDHDMVNDNSDSTFPGIDNTLMGYQEMFPHYPLPSASNGIWHKFTCGNTDIFMLDNRAQRDPNLNAFDIFSPDSVVFNPKPGHSILGEEQMNWLLQELRNSTADWKFISTGVVFNPAMRVGLELAVLLQGQIPDFETPQGTFSPTDIAVAFSDTWAGFPEDIHKISQSVIQNDIQNVIFLSGDSHNSALDDGTSSIFPELMSGPLDRVNSRTVSFLEQFGIYIWNKGGHTSNQTEFGNAYGKVSVFGSDSVRLEAVSESGTILGQHTVESGYLPTSKHIAIAPNGLDFGNVKVGEVAIFGYLAVSTSIDTVTVSSLEVVGDETFIAIPPGQVPFTVAPGKRALVGVLYAPTAKDTNQAIIQMTTNAPKTPGFQVSLQGVGVTEPVAINERSGTAEKFMLHQNYPNPFNPSTVIQYSLPKGNDVIIEIYDVNGQKIGTLVDGYKAPGSHQVTWNGKNENGEKMATGFYFYRIQSGDFIDSKKMLLLR